MHTYYWSRTLKAFRGNQFYEFSLYWMGWELILWAAAPKRFWSAVVQRFCYGAAFRLRMVVVTPRCNPFTIVSF